MKKKLNTISLPLISPDRKTHRNFFSVCIKAIEDNKDGVLNKRECINNIMKLNEETMRKFRNYGKTSLSFKTSHNNELKLKTKKIINKRRTLSQILEESEKLEKIEALKKELGKEEQNKNITKKRDSEEEDIKTKIFEFKNIKSTKNILKKKLNQNNIKTNVNKNKEKLKKVSKRYCIFRRITEYLESNDIPLFELLKHNPFQRKPYQISKGYEFLEAVKFKNYQFVREALQISNDYLFVIDYYGQTCYHWAAKLGDIKMLTILLDYGKHHNQKDFKGRTPLYLAAVNNNKEICDLLIRHKANIHLKDNLGYSASDVAGSKELKYYLSDLMTQPFSNPIFKKRMAEFLRRREKNIEENKIKKRLKEIDEEHKIEFEDENEKKE